MTEQVREKTAEEQEKAERFNREAPTEPHLTTADVAARNVDHPAAVRDGHERVEPLLPGDQTAAYQGSWNEIQGNFVDEPRRAVEQADSLVAEVMQHLAKTFADERQNLESQWGRGDNVSTEDLRIALQRYRSFFTRLLTI
ncbi:MAG TPA: hypothetical protein VFG11_05465 [Acidobacteriota bacterium]|nr:hypothetical protein [Acidobacteriota bacterium]